jgi:DNA-binding response OmpR family regulator
MNPKYHLLIVDENPYVADILIQTLKADFTVTVAHTGHEAARLLIQGHRFDCVVTELDLPVFSGLELTKLIRMSKLIFQTPIIILSNVPDSNTRIECLEQGVDSYITKPFNPLEVKAKIHAILRRTATSQETLQQTNASVNLQTEDKSFWPTKSKIFSALFRSTLVAQSA